MTELSVSAEHNVKIWGRTCFLGLASPMGSQLLFGKNILTSITQYLVGW